jgi:cytochrome c-type biogenesis protein CcmH
VRRVLALAGAALALTAAAPQASLSDIEDEVMCDTCNVALNIAESPRATQQREEIRDLIAQGLTKEQILDTLEDRYGPAILALPQDEGFSLAAYVVPVVVAVALLALGALLLPRWRRRRTAPLAVGGPALSADDERRLDEDLARFGT